MESGLTYLDEIIKCLDSDWKQKIDLYLKEETENIKEEEQNLIEKFLLGMKEDVIAEKTHNLKEIEKKVDNDLLFRAIQEHIDERLYPYSVAAPIRAMEARDKNKAEVNLKKIFQRAILRFDPQILDQSAEIGFNDRDALLEFLNVLDSMCVFLIERNFTCSAIEKFIYQQFRISKKNCSELAKLIDANFSELKMNRIIELLNKRNK